MFGWTGLCQEGFRSQQLHFRTLFEVTMGDKDSVSSLRRL